MSSFAKTFVGYPTAASASDEPASGVALRDAFRDDPADDDFTAVERLCDDATSPGTPGVLRIGAETDHQVLSQSMVEELRRRLREAEAREESGVRERPTPERGIDRELVMTSAAPATLAPVEVDLELSFTDEPERRADVREAPAPEGLDAILGAVAELEVSLAPNSESNFYAGFDEQHPDGVFVATYQRLEVSTPVYVDVLMPAGYRFRTAAVVEWVREQSDEGGADAGLPAGLGLKMCELTEAHRRLVRSFAKHRKPIFYIG